MVNPSRPNEIICMTLIYLPTREGDFPTFVAFDQYSHFCFMVEPFERLGDAEMMKAVARLMDHKDFQETNHKDFTLMVDFGEDILEELNIITQEHEGNVLFRPEEVKEATKEDLKFLFESMN